MIPGNASAALIPNWPNRDGSTLSTLSTTMIKEKPWTSALQQKTPQLDSSIDTLVNLIDSIDQPQGVHKIKTTLFSISLPKLCKLQSLALESTNYDYESAEYRVTAIILDTAQYRLFRPVHSDILSTDTKTHFIRLDFINKGIDAVNLPSILRSKSVIETVPTYFKEKQPPIISYTYTKTIANKIFNFSSILSDLDYHQYHNNPSQCECNTSSHLYQPYGHVITGELSIIPNFKLRDLIAKGPKYRAMQSRLGQKFITFV